jgi:hypothetical protein
VGFDVTDQLLIIFFFFLHSSDTEEKLEYNEGTSAVHRIQESL